MSSINTKFLGVIIAVGTIACNGYVAYAENTKEKSVASSSFKTQINKRMSELKASGFTTVKIKKVKFKSLDTENDRFEFECLDNTTDISGMGCRKGLTLEMSPYKTLIKGPGKIVEGDIIELYFAENPENSSFKLPIGIRKASH